MDEHKTILLSVRPSVCLSVPFCVHSVTHQGAAMTRPALVAAVGRRADTHFLPREAMLCYIVLHRDRFIKL